MLFDAKLCIDSQWRVFNEQCHSELGCQGDYLHLIFDRSLTAVHLIDRDQPTRVRDSLIVAVQWM